MYNKKFSFQQFGHKRARDEAKQKNSEEEFTIDNKYQQIVTHSGAKSQDEYHEIVTQGNDIILTKPHIFVEKFVPQQTVHIVSPNQVVNFDCINFEVLRCQNDDSSDRVISSEVEVNAEEQQTELLQNTSNMLRVDNHTLITHNYNNSENNEETQYVQVIEQDSIPIVFFSPSPQSEMAKDPPIEKPEKPNKNNLALTKELMQSPNFKMYIYSCKLCDFKCNAIKELTAHKLQYHVSTSGRFAKLARPPEPLMTHKGPSILFNLTCPACDFSSSSKNTLKRHLIKIHGIKTPADGTDNEYELKEPKMRKTSKPPPELKYTDVFLSRVSNIFCCTNCGFETDSKHAAKQHDCRPRKHANREH